MQNLNKSLSNLIHARIPRGIGMLLLSQNPTTTSFLMKGAKCWVSLFLLSLLSFERSHTHALSFNTIRKLPEDSLSFSITSRAFISYAKFQPGVNFEQSSYKPMKIGAQSWTVGKPLTIAVHPAPIIDKTAPFYSTQEGWNSAVIRDNNKLLLVTQALSLRFTFPLSLGVFKLNNFTWKCNKQHLYYWWHLFQLLLC